MRKLFTLMGLLACFWHVGFSQDYYLPLGSSKTETAVVENTYDNLRMFFTLEEILGKQITSKNGQEFTELYFGNGYSIGEIGTPKLPAFKRLVQIPFGAEVEVKVIGYKEAEYSLSKIGVNSPLFPVQPSLRKDMDIDEVPFEYSAKAYSADGFQNNPIAKIEILGVMRGVRVARIEVAPVDYDPTNGIIKVYNDIEVEVLFKNVDKGLNQTIRATTYSPYFESVYGFLANSYSKDVYDDHPDLTNYPVKMLIISNRMFEATLQPYIQWKTKKGFKVDVAYTDVIGTTSAAIQTYIHGIYNNSTPANPAPSFLVFVGDVEQVPASATGSSSAKKTDLYYASVDGDYFPEMYYGRLSATNTTQLQNIINKIIYYEQYQFADPTYLNNTTLIAGVDGNWNPKVGQPTIKYGTANYFNAAHGFNTVWGYGVANDPNNPNNSPGYTGCYANERISVGFINYTAHCSETSWGDPLLSISAVNGFTNTNKYPLAIGNCCLAADFGYSECIGETWIRGANKGAVTYIGSSPSSYWFEDFYWAVGAFPIVGTNDGYVPTVAQTTVGAYDAPFISDYLCAGGIVFAGNLAVTEVDIQNYPSHSSPLYYWQAYNVLGDPSVIHYLTEGETNTVSHMAIVPIGLNTYTVNALPGSYIAISKDGVLHGAAIVDGSGEVEVPIEPILSGGNVDIVITRAQTQPYMVQVPAAALEGPYIVLDSYTIDDSNGNNNGQADFGETFTINVTLKNVGADNATGVTATLTGTDNFFTVTAQGPTTFGAIQAGDNNNTATVNSAFSFTLANNVPNQYQATFVLTITDGNDTWQSNLKITGKAPILSIGNLTIDDGGQGVPNFLEPGEAAQVILTVSNTGHAFAGGVQVSISAQSPFFNLLTSSATVDVDAQASVQVAFDVEANAATPDGLALTISYEAIMGSYDASGATGIHIGPLPETTVGSGTEDQQSSAYYPLDNYYKANRSQSLYFASEVSPAPQTITQLGFYMKSIGTVNPYVNLTIKLMETSITEIPTSFVNTTTATTVFTAATYTMPSNVGWLVFDIEDFEYSGQSNLLVEVSFGLNASWTSTRYTVNCTTTPVNTVAYGYSDTQALPSYTNRTTKRPNLFLAFEAELSDLYPVTVTVHDQFGDAMPEALVMIGSLPLALDESGAHALELPNGTYPWMASQAGYVPETGQLEVADGAATLPIVLNLMINDDAEILAFGFTEVAVDAVTISPVVDHSGTVDVLVPYGTSLTSLTPEITVSYGATLTPAGGVPTDFSAPVAYTVTAESGNVTNTYTVTVGHSAELFTLTLVADPAEGGEVSGGGDYAEGVEVTVEASPSYGYLFVGWYDAEGEALSAEATYAYTMPGEDVELTARFEVITYTLTLVSLPEDAGVLSGAGAYAEGAEVAVAAEAAYGYAFTAWTDAAGDTLAVEASFTYVMPAGDVELTARFEVLPTYALTLSSSPAGAGTLEGAGSYVEGEAVEVSATPGAGYLFVSWKQGEVEVSGDASFTYVMPAEAVELTAHFEALPTYALTLVASPAGAGTLTGAGSYLAGAEVEVSATPGAGYLFVSWKQGEVEVSGDASFTYVMPAEAVELTAYFEAEVPTYTVTFVVTCTQSGALEGAEVALNGGTPVATNADGEAVFTGLEANTYTYTVTKDTHHAVAGEVVVDQNLTMPVSIVPLSAELSLLNGLSVYPNPFDNTLNITNSDKVERVVISNIVGQIVLDESLNGRTSINTSEVSRGIYLVSFYAINGEVKVMKLIKQ